VVSHSPYPAAPATPHVTVGGQDLAVTWFAVNAFRHYTLTDNKGRRYDAARVAIGSTVTNIRAALRRRNDYVLDERGWLALFVEDGEGGLTQIRAGTPEFRAAANEALAERGLPPLPDGTENVAVPVEIPADYLSQRDLAASLRSRLDALTYGEPVRVPVPNCELFAAVLGDDLYTAVNSRRWDAPRCAVFGTVTIGRSTYTVGGVPGALWVRNEAGTRGVSRRAAQAVRDVVEAAWGADGEHAELRDTAAASDLLRRDSSEGWTPDEVQRAADRARPHLLRLGTMDLRADARKVAVDASATFPGTVQDLRDVACAIAGLPAAPPRQ